MCHSLHVFSLRVLRTLKKHLLAALVGECCRRPLAESAADATHTTSELRAVVPAIRWQGLRPTQHRHSLWLLPPCLAWATRSPGWAGNTHPSFSYCTVGEGTP